jgi:hydroxyacylglutathione hydrolase
VIIQRAENAQWLSNAYLVVDRPGGSGIVIDSNEATDPLLERVEREGTRVTHILLTHHHFDHVAGLGELRERLGNPPVLAHPLTRELIAGPIDDAIEDGSVVRSGELEVEAIATPGHCPDHLALLIGGTDVVTADVLFRGTVGGTRGGGPSGFEDLKRSVMERLMTLSPETRIHPGHRQPSTIGEEWEHNPFVRVWRGLDEEGAEPCTVGPADAAERERATLVLWAPDYDGGHKAWVRFPSGEDAIVGGSQVERG